MVNARKFLGGRYFAVKTTTEPVTVTMVDVIEDEKMDDGSTEAVLKFKETEKKLVLKPTITKTLIDLFGDETKDWMGKRIEVYVNPDVEFAGQRTGGVRVRAASETPFDELNGEKKKKKKDKKKKKTAEVEGPKFE